MKNRNEEIKIRNLNLLITIKVINNEEYVLLYLFINKCLKIFLINKITRINRKIVFSTKYHITYEMSFKI